MTTSMSKSEVTNFNDIKLKNIFTIESTDIILKEFQLEDLDELYALTLQSEITDILPDWKATKDQRKKWLINMHMKSNKEFLEAVPNIEEQWLTLGLILKETNEFIGWCCTGPIDELPEPNREIAYAISKYHRNKGYTTQAVQRLISYLFENTNVEILNAIALTNNTPSNRVIEKCGFRYIDNLEIGNREFYHYKLSKIDLSTCHPSFY
jgi:[ribosomal protein S5]-alanine N-acetyltransferase